MDFSFLRFDEHGLIPAVIQDIRNGDVLMVAYMDVTALERTLSTGNTWFWSRSRQKYWRKGDTSGNIQVVKEVRYDCDEDCLLVLVEQQGVACHTGERSCFYRAFGKDEKVMPPVFVRDGEGVLPGLFRVIEERKRSLPEGSYTAKLLQGGLEAVTAKVEEESAETVEAAREGDRDHLIWEAGDLIYHLLVLLSQQSVTLEEVERELARRRK